MGLIELATIAGRWPPSGRKATVACDDRVPQPGTGKIQKMPHLKICRREVK